MISLKPILIMECPPFHRSRERRDVSMVLVGMNLDDSICEHYECTVKKITVCNLSY